VHLRTTNVVESPFATVQLRQRVTKGIQFNRAFAPSGAQPCRSEAQRAFRRTAEKPFGVRRELAPTVGIAYDTVK